MIKTIVNMKRWTLGILTAGMLCATGALAQNEPEPAPDTNSTSITTTTSRGHFNHHQSIVSFSAVEVGPTESADSVVVIGSSAIIRGNVSEDVVVIGGDVQVEGEINGQVVAIFGNVRVGEKGKVRGDVVNVGGESTIADGGKIVGNIVNVVNFNGAPLFHNVRWAQTWFSECFLKIRPLSLKVGWIWWIVLIFFNIYALIALLFPHPVQACLTQLNERPATTLAAGIAAKLALPIVCLLLPVTIVGFFLIPFVIVGFIVAMFVGKAALMEYFGHRFAGTIDMKLHPMLAFLIGAVVVTALYLVPVVGFLAFWVFGFWGLGGAMTALFLAWRARRKASIAAAAATKPRPPTPSSPTGPTGPLEGPTMPPPVTSMGAAVTPAPAPATSTIVPSADPVTPSATIPPPETPITPAPAFSTAAPVTPARTYTPVTPTLPPALMHPRASLLERLGAGFLDIVLITIISAWGGPLWFVVALAYFVGLWAWRGTTVGGIILNLQVVREDGGPLSIGTCIVRALASVFSVVILFLGFFWIVWDPYKQAWHDKIAGTVVVRLPKAVSLICY